ncbi:hypothetical protein [Pseudomonas aeruginosa]|uniref:hypothetical protein n=1 Tax=Pseudomonas aeruginosa TaxID=287 RepID=UPI003FD3A45A
MQGQTGIAKKVYECVPISEPWRSFQVLTALRNMTGSTPDVRIVQDGLRAQRSNAAYMHGYRNGVSDRTGIPHERAEVLRRRAEMIPGITPNKVWFQGRVGRG